MLDHSLLLCFILIQLCEARQESKRISELSRDIALVKNDAKLIPRYPDFPRPTSINSFTLLLTELSTSCCFRTAHSFLQGQSLTSTSISISSRTASGRETQPVSKNGVGEDLHRAMLQSGSGKFPTASIREQSQFIEDRCSGGL